MKTKLVRIVKSGSLFILILFFQSCASAPINLEIAKEKVSEYYESGQYDKDAAKVVSNAISEFGKLKVGDSSAVVFDIDETVLSNYEVIKELDFGYVPGLWDKWIDEAKAPAITEVKKLYNYLLGRHVKVIFITGRKDYQYSATYKNLINAGYKNFDTLIVRSKNEYDLSAQQFKSMKREELTAKGYKIIGDVGDQYSDLNGADHGIQVKIPNYLYIIK